MEAMSLSIYDSQDQHRDLQPVGGKVTSLEKLGDFLDQTWVGTHNFHSLSIDQSLATWLCTFVKQKGKVMLCFQKED